MKLKELENTGRIKNTTNKFVLWVRCPKCRKEYHMALEYLNLPQAHICNCPNHHPMFRWMVKEMDMIVYPEEKV